MSMAYKWVLEGSWPQTIRDGDLSYTRSEVKIVEVVVVYDWAETDEVSPSELGPPDSDYSPERE